YRILPPAPARQFGGKTRAQRGQLGAEPRPGPAAGHDQPARGPLWITRGQPCAYPRLEPSLEPILEEVLGAARSASMPSKRGSEIGLICARVRANWRLNEKTRTWQWARCAGCSAQRVSCG